MDKNVTHKGLLALKDSKPVPITAHTHEIIIPCVYTEVVKKVMKEKGITLPLNPHKLAELRRIAKATPGKYKPEPSDHKDEGDSHAKGTKDLKKGKKRKGRKEDKEKTVVSGKTVAVARAKTNANVLQNINKIMLSPPSIPQARPAEYSLIRPFSYAAQSTPETISLRFKADQKEDEKKEREEANRLREEKERAHRMELLDTLTKRMDEQAERTKHHILDHLITSAPWRSKGDEHQEEVYDYFANVNKDVPAQPAESIVEPQPQEDEKQEAKHESEEEEEEVVAGELGTEDKKLYELLDDATVNSKKPGNKPKILEIARELNVVIPRGHTKKSDIIHLIVAKYSSNPTVVSDLLKKKLGM